MALNNDRGLRHGMPLATPIGADSRLALPSIAGGVVDRLVRMAGIRGGPAGLRPRADQLQYGAALGRSCQAAGEAPKRSDQAGFRRAVRLPARIASRVEHLGDFSSSGVLEDELPARTHQSATAARVVLFGRRLRGFGGSWRGTGDLGRRPAVGRCLLHACPAAFRPTGAGATAGFVHAVPRFADDRRVCRGIWCGPCIPTRRAS